MKVKCTSKVAVCKQALSNPAFIPSSQLIFPKNFLTLSQLIVVPLAAVSLIFSGNTLAAACVSGQAISNGTTCDLPASTSVIIDAWAGGGGGARTNADGFSDAYSGGGGAGGGYCRYTVTTTAGTDTVTATVGAGGLAGEQFNILDDGQTGGNSTAVYTPSAGGSVNVIANGGGGGQLGDLNGTAGMGTGGTGGAGCPTSGSFVGFSGGAGGSGALATSSGTLAAGGGGGGSSAGSASVGNTGGNGIEADGSNTSHGSGGNTPTDGGAGGDGGGDDGFSESFSATGFAPGGGGGGGGFSLSFNSSVGSSNGAAGQVIVSWGGAGDTTAPATPTLSIDGGAATTHSTTVTIVITNDTDNVGVTGWFVSETNSAPTAGAGGWVGVEPTNFTLSGGDGTKTVYVWTKDAAANVSASGSDSIDYSAPDTTVPATPSLSIDGGAASTNSTGVAIAITNDTDNIGVTGWFVSETNSTPGAGVGGWVGVEPTSFTLSGGYGTKTVYVWTKDAAANVSATGSDTITYGQVISGTCGISDNRYFESTPSENLCSSGAATIVSKQDKWSWSCSGANGGGSASCSATIRVNGVCGSSSGSSFTSIPVTGLCTAGTTTSILGDGPWSWSCLSENQGSHATCISNVVVDNQNTELLVTASIEVLDLLNRTTIDEDKDQVVTTTLSATDTVVDTVTSGAGTQQTIDAISGANDVLKKIDEKTTTLSDSQVSQVKDIVLKALESATTTISTVPLVDASVEETTELINTVSNTIESSVKLGATLDQDLLSSAQTLTQTALENTLADIASALDSSLNVSFTDVATTQTLLSSNTQLLSAVLDTIQIKLSSTVSLDQTQTTTQLTNAGMNQQSAYNLVSNLAQFVNPTGVSLTTSDDQTQITAADTITNSLPSGSTLNINNDTNTGLITIDDYNFPVNIASVALVPESIPEGLTILPDGSALTVSGGIASTLLPAPQDPVAFASALGAIGADVSFDDDGSIAITSSSFNFSGTFAFDNVTSSGSSSGGVSIAAPTGSPADPSYTYTVNYPDGTSQNILPFVSDDDFFDSLGGQGFNVSTNRSTGVLAVGESNYKPDYFVTPLSSTDQSFLNANQDSTGTAYRAVDVNGDGVTDYEVISGYGVQVVYGVP